MKKIAQLAAITGSVLFIALTAFAEDTDQSTTNPSNVDAVAPMAAPDAGASSFMEPTHEMSASEGLTEETSGSGAKDEEGSPDHQ